jgi:hypothetical protein
MLNRAAIAPLVAAVAALVIVAATASSALGSSPYTLKLTICKPCQEANPSINVKGHFPVQVAGTSSKTSQLSVFNVATPCDLSSGQSCTTPKCAKSAGAEGKLAAHQIIRTNVTHSFTKRKTAYTPNRTGPSYICAYLTSGTRTLAHASGSYSIIYGGYP